MQIWSWRRGPRQRKHFSGANPVVCFPQLLLSDWTVFVLLTAANDRIYHPWITMSKNDFANESPGYFLTFVFLQEYVIISDTAMTKKWNIEGILSGYMLCNYTISTQGTCKNCTRFGKRGHSPWLRHNGWLESSRFCPGKICIESIVLRVRRRFSKKKLQNRDRYVCI